jgi:glycerophosphoryl diester phosphodiesterase
MREAKRLALPVHVWTVNQRAEMERLLDLGIDGIMTDDPETLGIVFAERGLDLAGNT